MHPSPPPVHPHPGVPSGAPHPWGCGGGVGEWGTWWGRGGAHGVGCSGVGRLNRFSGTKRNGKKLIRHLIRINKAGDWVPGAPQSTPTQACPVVPRTRGGVAGVWGSGARGGAGGGAHGVGREGRAHAVPVALAGHWQEHWRTSHSPVHWQCSAVPCRTCPCLG